jgi:WD40 repeat protein
MMILTGHPAPIEEVAFSADGAALLSVDGEGGLRLWDLNTRQARRKMDGGLDSPTFTPDGKHILCTDGDDGWAYLLDIETGEWKPLRLSGDDPANAYLFSPDGTRCVVRYGSKLEWRQLPSWKRVKTWDISFPEDTEEFQQFVFSPDGRTLAGVTDCGVYLFDVATRKRRPLPAFEPTSSELLLAFHPDSQRLAVGFGKRMAVVELAAGKETAAVAIKQPRKSFMAAAYTPDGRYLATVSGEETVKFWDTSSGQVAKEYNWQVGRLYCLAFSRDGCLGAAGGAGKQVAVWDMEGHP